MCACVIGGLKFALPVGFLSPLLSCIEFICRSRSFSVPFHMDKQELWGRKGEGKNIEYIMADLCPP